MAITIASSPDSYSSIHNPLWFVVTSNNNTQTNFKFVCDIYVATTLVARLKSFPDPRTGWGIFNVASVVRDYWESYFKPKTTLPDGFVYKGNEIYTSYEVKFGEEYGGTTYTNLATSSKKSYNYVSDYLYTDTSNILRTPALYQSLYAGTYITNRDKTQLKFPKESIGSGYYFITSLCDLEDTTRSQSLDVSVYNGTTTTNYTGAASSFKDFALIDVSPRSINQYLGTSAIGSTTIYYDVKFKITGAVVDSVRITMTCSQYESIPLHFLNSVGGYDSFIFTQVNRQTRNIEKSSYERLEWEPEIATQSMQRVGSYGKFNGGMIPFVTRQSLSYKLISDWVNYVDYNWLKELIASPEVYMERNNQFIPVTISTTSWTEKKRFADKAFNLELDIELANKVNSQFR
jgi:hypothetical protein